MMDTPLHSDVAASVGQYEGAYSTLKVAPEMMPARFPKPTKKPVLAARLDSSKSLLLCLASLVWVVSCELHLHSPGMNKHGGNISSGCHKEAGEVRHTFVLQCINAGKDDHANQRDCKCSDYVKASLSEVV